MGSLPEKLSSVRDTTGSYVSGRFLKSESPVPMQVDISGTSWLQRRSQMNCSFEELCNQGISLPLGGRWLVRRPSVYLLKGLTQSPPAGTPECDIIVKYCNFPFLPPWQHTWEGTPQCYQDLNSSICSPHVALCSVTSPTKLDGSCPAMELVRKILVSIWHSIFHFPWWLHVSTCRE